MNQVEIIKQKNFVFFNGQNSKSQPVSYCYDFNCNVLTNVKTKREVSSMMYPISDVVRGAYSNCEKKDTLNPIFYRTVSNFFNHYRSCWIKHSQAFSEQLQIAEILDSYRIPTSIVPTANFELLRQHKADLHYLIPELQDNNKLSKIVLRLTNPVELKNTIDYLKYKKTYPTDFVDDWDTIRLYETAVSYLQDWTAFCPITNFRLNQMEFSVLHYYVYKTKWLSMIKSLTILEDGFTSKNNHNYWYREAVNTITPIFAYIYTCRLLGEKPKKEANSIREFSEMLQSATLRLNDSYNKILNSRYDQKRKILEFEYEDYCVVVPPSTEDIIQEGVKQANCVGTYINSILKGNTFVVFIRKKESPSSPYITCEVSPSTGNIKQFLLPFNRIPDDERDKKFKREFQKHLHKNWES